MNEITTIKTTTGSTYIIIDGDSITRLSDKAMQNCDGLNISTQLDCADWQALRTPRIGDSLLGLADGERLTTSAITSIESTLAS